MTTVARMVPADDYRDVVHRFGQAADMLDAIEMFSPLNLARLVKRLDDIINAADTRIAYLEYRLDQAGIKDLADGIPDDVAEQYFTLPNLRSGEPW